jgi:hypothetical protein
MMTRGGVLAGLTGVVALLLALVGLVALSDIHKARSSQIVPNRMLLDSRDHSAQAAIRLEGRLLGDMGKSIQVKQADCEIKLPFCNGDSCAVFHITSEGLVHDQNEFTKVQIPMLVRAGVDLKTAQLRLQGAGLDLGDLRATCGVTYAYRRFEYFTIFERTITYEWSLQELANKMSWVDPKDEGTASPKQQTTRLSDVARFGFMRKNISFQRPNFESMQYLSSVVSGDAELHIAPGKVADAIADFLSRVKIEVQADVRYTDSALHAFDGLAYLQGQCSHKVNTRGGVKVSLPVMARGRVHTHAILSALAKTSQEPQLMFEDSLNQVSHAHSIEFVNEPRSFVGNLFGLSHKMESRGTIVADGIRVRDLQKMVSKRYGRSLQSLREFGQFSIHFSEQLWLGDTNVTVKASIIGGTPMNMELTFVLASHSERTSAAARLKYNSDSKDWDGGIQLLHQGMDALETSSFSVKLDGTYLELTKSLTADVNVGFGSVPGEAAEEDDQRESVNITANISAIFRDSLPSFPEQASVVVKGLMVKDGSQAETVVPKTSVKYAMTEVGNVEKHKLTVSVAQFESKAHAYETLVPSAQSLSDDPSGYPWAYDLRQTDYENELKFLSDMSGIVELDIDKSRNTDWGVTGSVNMQTSCAVEDDFTLQQYLVTATGSDLAAFNALKTSTNARKYYCDDGMQTSCQSNSSFFQCCKSHQSTYESVFNDETACGAPQLHLLELVGLTAGSTVQENFNFTIDPVEDGEHEYKLGASNVSVNFKFKDLNDMMLKLVINGSFAVDVDVKNNWANAVDELRTQGLTVVVKDGTNKPTFSLNLIQNNTRNVVTIANDGAFHLHQDGKVQLYALGLNDENLSFFRLDGSMDVAETASQNSISGALALDVNRSKVFDGTVSLVGGASSPYVLDAKVHDEDKAVVAKATSIMSKNGTLYAGDVSFQVDNETKSFVHTAFSTGFLPIGASDRFDMSISLGSQGNGYDDLGGDFAWYMTRGPAPVRGFSGFGVSVDGHEFFGVPANVSNRQQDPKVAVSLDVRVPHNVEVDPSQVGIAKVTTFVGLFQMENPEDFSTTSYLKSIPSVAGVKQDKVRVKLVKYLCKVAYSFADAQNLTEAQARTTVALTAAVAEDMVTIELTPIRRLRSADVGIHDGGLSSTMVKASIAVDSPADLNAVSTKIANTVALKTNLENATGTAVGTVAVTEAPKKLIEVETEIESEAGLPAVEVPSADSLSEILSSELGSPVATESLTVEAVTSKQTNPNADNAGSSLSGSSTVLLNPASILVLGVASLSVCHA